MQRFTSKVDGILTAFEPDSADLTENLGARLEAARGRLEGFIRRVAEDTIQYSLGLMKSHFPEADLELVSDRIVSDTTDLVWLDYLSSARPIAERVAADLNL